MTKKVASEIAKITESMTPKQIKFLSLWLKTGNGTKSAMEAYDTDDPGSAASIANENLRKLKNPMKLFCEARGMGIDRLYKVIDDAMVAEKTDITGDKHPDHKIRLEAGDRLSKWLDVEPDPTVALQQNFQINVNRGDENG